MTSNIGAELLTDLADRLTFYLETTGLDQPNARAVAQNAAAYLADTWGGQSVYFPKDMVARMSTRNEEIYDSFTGDNISELVRTYGLSRQAIYRIIKAERQRRSPKQISLFQHM